MLYVFADIFCKNAPNPCASTGNGVDLSTGDKRELRLLYPETVVQLADRAAAALEIVGQESVVGDESPYLPRIRSLLAGIAGVWNRIRFQAFHVDASRKAQQVRC